MSAVDGVGNTDIRVCRECGQAGEFYRSAVQVFRLCKKCYNAACVERKRRLPEYRARQQAAKRRWTLANPERKRAHEGRALVRSASAPAGLVELERVFWTLNGAMRGGKEA